MLLPSSKQSLLNMYVETYEASSKWTLFSSVLLQCLSPQFGFYFLSKRIFYVRAPVYVEACSLRNLITFYQFSVIMINHRHWKVAIVAKGTIQVLSDSFQSFLAYPTHKNVSFPKKKTLSTSPYSECWRWYMNMIKKKNKDGGRIGREIRWWRQWGASVVSILRFCRNVFLQIYICLDMVSDLVDTSDYWNSRRHFYSVEFISSLHTVYFPGGFTILCSVGLI